jgi:hypothetical protein
MTRHHRGVPLLALMLAGGLIACSPAQPGTPTSPTPDTASTVDTRGAAGTTTTPVTSNTTGNATSGTTPLAGCQSGTVAIHVDAPPTVPVCLRTAATLQLTAQPSPHQPWQPLVSSDPGVVRCQSTPAADGSLTGTCVAVASGSAALRTSTAPFPGDPHGPPQQDWTITVIVVS